jgi:hypothetical protein
MQVHFVILKNGIKNLLTKPRKFKFNAGIKLKEKLHVKVQESLLRQ